MDPRTNERREPLDPTCHECRHYFITHDAAHPWGCRAFGIASTRKPAVVVREVTGKRCEGFERKEVVRR